MNLDGQFRKVIQELVKNGVDMQQATEEFKLKFVEEALKLNGDSVCATADALGIHRNTINKLLKKREANGKKRPGR